ncbi:hypothetical protein JB92DRAFT_2809890 [Gautieria morchelliformis]|nr:hypothetical protein JB92DRAFT_2809890 [Gautieria morchelliformis]
MSSSATSLSYGVHYTLQTQQSHFLTVDRLSALRIRYVRITWVDLTNVTRLRIVPLSHFLRMLASPRPAITMSRFVLGAVFLSIAEGFTTTGEYLYLPDLESLRVCPYAPGHASVMGCYEEKVPVPGPDGMPTLKVDLCPRATLKRILDDASATAGVEFLVGYEIEVTLLKSTNPITSVNDHSWSASAGLYTGTKESLVLQEIADALQESGIELQMYHPEAAPGQYEVVTGPLPPLQAADALVHTRETISNIAVKHELRATFAPRVFKTRCGGGLHTHISLHPVAPAPTSLPSSPSEHLTPLQASFLAGLLLALPELALLTLPTPASYARVGDGMLSGGTYVSWGTDVREAPVRLCNAASPGSRNFELRAMDAIANPYAALAGVLGAGARGVRQGLKLEIDDCSVRRGGVEMSEDERRAYGITVRMPLAWEAARLAMESSKVVREVLGDTFVDGYLSVNKLMAAQYDTPETEEGKLKLLIENY